MIGPFGAAHADLHGLLRVGHDGVLEFVRHLRVLVPHRLIHVAEFGRQSIVALLEVTVERAALLILADPLHGAVTGLGAAIFLHKLMVARRGLPDEWQRRVDLLDRAFVHEVHHRLVGGAVLDQYLAPRLRGAVHFVVQFVAQGVHLLLERQVSLRAGQGLAHFRQQAATRNKRQEAEIAVMGTYHGAGHQRLGESGQPALLAFHGHVGRLRREADPGPRVGRACAGCDITTARTDLARGDGPEGCGLGAEPGPGQPVGDRFHGAAHALEQFGQGAVHLLARAPAAVSLGYGFLDLCGG